jgi:hypothetical protein
MSKDDFAPVWKKHSLKNSDLPESEAEAIDTPISNGQAGVFRAWDDDQSIDGLMKVSQENDGQTNNRLTKANQTKENQAKETEPVKISNIKRKQNMTSSGNNTTSQTVNTWARLKSFDYKQWWGNLSDQQRRNYKLLGSVTGGLLVLLVLVSLVAWHSYAQAQVVKAELQQAATEGRIAYDSFKSQNLPATKLHLENTKQRLEASQQEFEALKWTGSLPFVGKYYHDGSAGLKAGVAGVEAGLLTVSAIEPHADVLGFTGEGSFEGGTTEDRIGLMLETLQQITPQLDAIGAKVEEMNSHVQVIDPADYPVEFSGYPVRSYVQQLHDGAAAAEVALTDFRPVIEQLPAMAGAGERQKYLIIFQNDNELRPTGGFMTAYAVVYVEDGKLTPEKSDDIYEVDQKFRNKPPIPEILGKYLTTESRWNLRDMNMDPNFSESMKTVYSYYQDIPGEPDDIDGIISVDTVLLAEIVEVLGPIEVPGYGTFSAENDPRCDCPQIIYALSEIIDRPTPYHREDRKGILAPMMQSIIQKTYATSRDKWPLLAELLWESIEGRHAQFYFLDEDKQLAAESINAAGIIPQVEEGQDYLTIIDANLGGAKSNLFTEVEGSQVVESMENGSLTKQVELTYRNTHSASNCNLEAGLLCLNANLNNWTRWYVPKGTTVQELVGFENGHTIDDSHEGYDIIEGFFKLAPMGQARIRATLNIPYSGEEYALRMQKQAGTDPIPFELTTPEGQVEFVLDKDMTVKVE